MEKGSFTKLEAMKRLKTSNIRDDLKQWFENNKNVTHVEFAEMAGISVRTLRAILGYTEDKKEPNYTREVIERILETIGCEAFYSPKHKIT